MTRRSQLRMTVIPKAEGRGTLCGTRKDPSLRSGMDRERLMAHDFSNNPPASGSQEPARRIPDAARHLPGVDDVSFDIGPR